MDLSLGRLPLPGSAISGTWVNRDGEMWRVYFALGKQVPLPSPLLLGASFHSIWCLLLFLPILGTILKGGKVGSKWELADFFFSVTWILSPSPQQRACLCLIPPLDFNKEAVNFYAGWDSCTISSNFGLGSFWTFSHACTTHQVPHTCAKTVGSLKI